MTNNNNTAPQGQNPQQPAADGKVVASFNPGDNNNNAPNQSAQKEDPTKTLFYKAFVDTLEDKGEGLLTPFLFYDIRDGQAGQNGSPQYLFQSASSGNEFISGGDAWDTFIRESQANGSYDFMKSDEAIIHHALNHGLLGTLNGGGTFSLTSYGPGDVNAIKVKEAQIIKAILDSDQHALSAICTVDILGRYATESAFQFHQMFNVKANAIQGDFMEGGSLNIPDMKGTQIITVFGGPFDNAPLYHGGPDAKHNTIAYLSKMNAENDLGHYVVMTADTEDDPSKQRNSYNPTKAFEAFVLSAFSRAVSKGVVTDPNYKVFDNWKLTLDFNYVGQSNNTRVESDKLVATAKQDHFVPITGHPNGGVSIKKGETRTHILSHKWDKATRVNMFNAAGYDVVQDYQIPGSKKVLFVLKSVQQAPAQP